jgi:DNA-binding response OmpR family regulator
MFWFVSNFPDAVCRLLGSFRPMKKPLRILAVDDEPSVVHAIAFALSDSSRKLSTACDAEGALHCVENDVPPPFDLIITDNNMPRMSGLDLVRRLRQENFGGKIIVLSAHLTDENCRAYSELGVDGMLPKPFDVHELRAAVDRLANAA